MVQNSCLASGTLGASAINRRPRIMYQEIMSRQEDAVNSWDCYARSKSRRIYIGNINIEDYNSLVNYLCENA